MELFRFLLYGAGKTVLAAGIRVGGVMMLVSGIEFFAFLMILDGPYDPNWISKLLTFLKFTAIVSGLFLGLQVLSKLEFLKECSAREQVSEEDFLKRDVRENYRLWMASTE